MKLKDSLYLFLLLFILCNLFALDSAWRRRRRRRRSCRPTHCAYSHWYPVGGCSRACGSGVRTWKRHLTRHASCGGGCSNQFTQTRPCNTHCCPVSCSVSAWSHFGACSTTCGSSGVQFRTRRKTRPESCGGSCPYSLREQRACNRKCCPVNCQQVWSRWTPCDCVGLQARVSRIGKAASCGGKACPRPRREYRRCSNYSRCKLGWCQFWTGRCICWPGYQGRTCSKPCPKGTFGHRCTKKCNCGKGTCRSSNGKCICPLGYTGKRCHIMYRCANGRYKCRALTSGHYRLENCIVRYTYQSKVTMCPSKTHYAAGCLGRGRCQASRLWGSRGCKWRCSKKLSFALCCPKRRYQP